MSDSPLAPYVRQRELTDRFWFDEMAILSEVYSHYDATKDRTALPKVMAFRHSLVLVRRVTRMLRTTPEVTEFQSYPIGPVQAASKFLHSFFPVVQEYESDAHRDAIHEHLRDWWCVSSNLVWEELSEALDWVKGAVEDMP